MRELGYRPASDIKTENERLKNQLKKIKPTIKIDPPKQLPGTKQDDIDFTLERINSLNLNLIERVKSHHSKPSLIGSQGDSALTTSEIQRLASMKELNMQKIIDDNKFNNEKLGQVKPTIQFAELDKWEEKRKYIKQVRGMEDKDWRRQSMPSNDVKQVKPKPAQYEGVVSPSVEMQLKNKLYFGTK